MAITKIVWPPEDFTYLAYSVRYHILCIKATEREHLLGSRCDPHFSYDLDTATGWS